MAELASIFELDKEQLLTSLDSYQTEIIKEFLNTTSNNYLQTADKWLNATPSNTAQFGGEINKNKIYREKLIEEIEKFVCGDEKYENDRQKISLSGDKSEKYIIGVMSVAIGGTLGVAGTFIAPIIVLLILSFGKIAKNAWCQMRKEIRDSAT